MPDCLAILVPDFPAREAALDAQVEWLDTTFPGRAWVGLTLHQRALDDIHRGIVEHIAARHAVPVVATGNVVMHVRSRKPLQDTMTAIRIGKPVAECGYALAPNAEQHLRSRLRLANLYPEYTLGETLKVIARCTFSLGRIALRVPGRNSFPEGYTHAAYLRQETYVGAHRRFPGGNFRMLLQAQIEHELDLIAQLGYEAYFLTVYDIVRYARSENILCQGTRLRGPTRRCATAWAWTEVDPARGNMLFERFISKERGEPPDIDVDFEHQRREEVIQYIYRKYGRDRSAIAAGHLDLSSAGRVARDRQGAGGRSAKSSTEWRSPHQWFGQRQGSAQAFCRVGAGPGDAPDTSVGVRSPRNSWGFPRHLSQHSGGFVISRGKLTRLVPIENAAMPERSVIQWDKDDLEALGLLKIDVLALGPCCPAIRRAPRHCFGAARRALRDAGHPCRGPGKRTR